MAIEKLFKDILEKKAERVIPETSEETSDDVATILAALEGNDVSVTENEGLDRIVESLLITKMILNSIMNG